MATTIDARFAVGDHVKYMTSLADLTGDIIAAAAPHRKHPYWRYSIHVTTVDVRPGAVGHPFRPFRLDIDDVHEYLPASYNPRLWAAPPPLAHVSRTPVITKNTRAEAGVRSCPTAASACSLTIPRQSQSQDRHRWGR